MYYLKTDKNTLMHFYAVQFEITSILTKGVEHNKNGDKRNNFAKAFQQKGCKK